MTDVRIGAGRNNFLTFGYLDGRRGKTIHLDHPKNEEKREHDKRFPYQRDIRRHRRPTKSYVERGHEDQGEESQEYQRHDDIVRPFLFMPRTRLYPPLYHGATCERK